MREYQTFCNRVATFYGFLLPFCTWPQSAPLPTYSGANRTVPRLAGSLSPVTVPRPAALCQSVPRSLGRGAAVGCPAALCLSVPRSLGRGAAVGCPADPDPTPSPTPAPGALSPPGRLSRRSCSVNPDLWLPDRRPCRRFSPKATPGAGLVGTLGFGAVPAGALDGSKALEAPSIHEGADSQFSATAPSLGRGSEGAIDL